MKPETLVITAFLFLIAAPLSIADYLPTMPPATGVFGEAIDASPTFQDGYHWDDPATPGDDRDIPEHYKMPSPMTGYTAGDELDYHWVWVNNLGDHVTWDMGAPISGVRVYPCQDHGPYTGSNSEFDEYRVWGSNDMVTWTEATETALYCDDIDNVRTHDGVKDYKFPVPYRYCRITSWIDSDFEIDAVEALSLEVKIDIKPGSDPNSINPKSKGVIPVAILTTDDFDATTVDPSSAEFGPDGASMVHKNAHLEDVDNDGDIDMVLHFKTQETGIQAGDTEATLTGETFDGILITGTDSIKVVGGKAKAAPSLNPRHRVATTWASIKAQRQE